MPQFTTWTSTTKTYILQPKEIHIYTDGSCLGDPTGEVPRPGGWAWTQIVPTNGAKDVSDLENTKSIKSRSRGYFASTNNRMEMMAAIDAILEATQQYPNADIVIHTDSQLIVNGFEKGWLDNWKKNGFKNAKGKAVENQDLWKTLDKVAEGAKSVKFEWVKGHAKNKWNEWCDEAAKAAAADPKFIDSVYENNRYDLSNEKTETSKVVQEDKNVASEVNRELPDGPFIVIPLKSKKETIENLRELIETLEDEGSAEDTCEVPW